MAADFLLGCFVWAVATSLGLGVFKCFGMRFESSAEKLVFSSALGLGVTSYLIFIIGFFKALYATPILLAIFVGLILSARPLADLFSEISNEFKKFKLRLFPDGVYALIAAAILILTLAGTLAPPIGQDELCYHLAQPKNFVLAHAVYEVPYSSSSLWPYLMEMLFTLGLLLRGPELAKFFHFALTLNAVGAIYCFGRRFGNARIGAYAALIFLVTPAVFIQASFAYVDNALACYVFLAAYALWTYFQNGRLRWAVLAGAMTGLAISIKLIGLFIVPLAVLAFIWMIFKKSGSVGRPLAALLSFLAMAGLAGGLWYLRSWVLRGNPVFPFYPRWFGGHGWSITNYVDSHGRGSDFAAFLLLLWDTTFHPQWFGGEQIGPMLLAFLPLVFFLKPMPSYLKYVLLFGVGYTALWFVVDPNIRFFYPALALFSVAMGAVAVSLTEEGPILLRSAARVLFISMLLVGASFAAHHFVPAARLWFGGNREAYAAERDRSFRAAKMLNRELKPEDRVVSVGEVRVFHFDPPPTIEGEVQRFTDYGNKLHSTAEVADFFRKRGFTHVLYFDKTPLPETGGSASFRLPFLVKKTEEWRDCFKEVSVVRVGSDRYVLYKIL